jgi:hypothetical protein
VPGIGSSFFYPCVNGPGTCGISLLAPTAATTTRSISTYSLEQAKAKIVSAQTELFQTDWLTPVAYTCWSAFITGDTGFFIDSVPFPDVRARISGQTELDYCYLENFSGAARIVGNCLSPLENVGKTIAFMRNGRLQQHTIQSCTVVYADTFHVVLSPTFVPDVGETLVVFPGVRDSSTLETAILGEWGSLGPGEVNTGDSPYGHRMARRPSKSSIPSDIDGSFATRFIQRLELSDGSLHYAYNGGICLTPPFPGYAPYLILPNGMGIYPS